jgi:hypothetical protein
MGSSINHDGMDISEHSRVKAVTSCIEALLRIGDEFKSNYNLQEDIRSKQHWLQTVLRVGTLTITPFPFYLLDSDTFPGCYNNKLGENACC